MLRPKCHLDVCHLDNSSIKARLGCNLSIMDVIFLSVLYARYISLSCAPRVDSHVLSSWKPSYGVWRGGKSVLIEISQESLTVTEPTLHSNKYTSITSNIIPSQHRKSLQIITFNTDTLTIQHCRQTLISISLWKGPYLITGLKSPE